MANAIPTDLKDRNRVAIVTGQKVKMCYNGEEIEGIVRVRGYRYRKRLFCVETKEGIRYPFNLMTNPRKQIEVIENYKYKQDKRTKFNSVPQKWDDYETLFVFSDDGRVSCRLSFYKDTPQDAVVSDLYVHESIRKQGCATAILNWCIECSKDRGCNSLFIRSDNDDWIRKWYERLGFKKKSSQVWLAMSINNEVFNKEYLKQ